MTHVNLDQLSQPENENNEFNRLEAKARDMMNNSSGDPIGFLDECIKEIEKVSPKLAAKLLASRSQIEQEIKLAGQRTSSVLPSVDSKESSPAASNDCYTSSKESSIADIGILQGSALGALVALAVLPATKMFDQNGDEIAQGQLHEKDGTARVVQFSKDNQSEASGFLGILGQIYNKLSDLGLKTKHSKKEIVDGEGQVHDSANYFAVALPKAYKGNKDPMTMNEEQLRNVLDIYEQDKNQEMDYFSVVVGSMAKNLLTGFYEKENRDFVKDLMLEGGVPEIGIGTSGFTKFSGNNLQSVRG